MTAGMHMLSLVTVGAVPEHRCYIDGIDTDAIAASWNSTSILDAIPLDADGDISSCSMYSMNKSSIIRCDKYIYDRTYYKTSRAIDWNFVCDKRWMIAIGQSMFMFGTFTGALILGGMADKYGRKKIFYISAILQLILGVGIAFIPWYIPFLIVQFLYGIFGSAGSYIPGFVLTMELVGASKRTPCGLAFQAFFAAGIMLVAAWGSIIADRQMLQMVYGLHSLLLVFHWWSK